MIQYGKIEDLLTDRGDLAPPDAPCSLLYWGRYPWPCPTEPVFLGRGQGGYFSRPGEKAAIFVKKGKISFTLSGGKIIVVGDGQHLVAGSMAEFSHVELSPDLEGHSLFWSEDDDPHLLHHETTANVEDGYNQWVVGHFIGQERHLVSRVVELKHWSYTGSMRYPPKRFMGKSEIITVEKGALRFNFDEIGSLIVSAGEYIILTRGVEKVVEVRNAPARGLTLRWPSVPDINQVGHA